MSDVKISVKTEGIDEILRKLKRLPERVQKNVVVGAVRASAKPIIKEARLLVPVRTGTLKKSIGIKKRRSKEKNIISFSVAPLSKKGGFYGKFVEFGTKKMSAHPFLRPAFEKKGEDSISSAKEYMRKRIDKEIAKL